MEYELVRELARQGVTDKHVLAAIMRVKRSAFVPEAYRALSHEDEALPLSCGQTISQPYVVAVMTAALQAKPGEKVLEVGTGSGYQAAVLAELGYDVYSIERLAELSGTAGATLGLQDYKVHLRLGDGCAGWPEEAPFSGIIVTAATSKVPLKLLEQLAPGRRMVIPLGSEETQQLCVLTRQGDSYTTEQLIGVRFVPLIEG